MKIKLIRELAVGAFALTALICPSLVADTVTDAIRAKLAIGDYPAALKAGDVKGAALTDDVRVLRSYARLASVVEAEAAAAGKRLGATQAKLDLFDTEASAFAFPQQITWANCQRASVFQVSRTRVRFTVPSYLERSQNVFEYGGDNQYSRQLDQMDPAELEGSVMVSFVNNSSRPQVLRIKRTLYLYGAYPGAFFINGEEVLPWTGDFSMRYFTYLPSSEGASYDFAALLQYINTNDSFVPLAPGAVLTVYPYPSYTTERNSLDVVSLPKDVTVYNGKYPQVMHSKLAATTSSTELFTTLGNLTKNAIDPTITDLLAVKAAHSLTLTSEESLSCVPTIIEQADRKAWLGLVKLLKAAGQLNTAYNLALPVGGTQLFDGSLDLLDVLTRNPNLLKLGTMPAKTRTTLLTLLGEAVTHLDEAANLGLVARDPLPTAEYLFSQLADVDQDYIQFGTTSANGARGISFAQSSSRNQLVIENKSDIDQTLTFTLDDADTSEGFYGSFPTSTASNSGEKSDSRFWFNAGDQDEFNNLMVEGYSNLGELNWNSAGLSVTLPAYSTVTLGGGADDWNDDWSDYISFDSGEQFDAGKVRLTLQGSLPSGVTFSVTTPLTRTQSFKDELAILRQYLTATGVALDKPLLGQNAKVSLAPLFAAKPVVLRDQFTLIRDDQNQIIFKPGTSNKLLQSGLLIGVEVPDWEKFLLELNF